VSEEQREGRTESRRAGTGNEQPTELVDSSPNAGGPQRAAGDMGVSSERVGPTGGGREGTDGESDASAPPYVDDAGDVVGSDAEFEQEPEENPQGIDPKAGYPSLDPRSKDLPTRTREPWGDRPIEVRPGRADRHKSGSPD
jgi:hypothetical protein